MNDVPSFGSEEWRLAYRVALRVLRCPDRAQDAAQDALLRAFRARDAFNGRGRFESWLYRVALTTALSHLRRPAYRQLAASSASDDPLTRVTSPGASPRELVAAADMATTLQGCLDGLRDADRVAFTERFLHGHSERDLGVILGVSANAAKQRAFRARRAVRQCMDAKGYTPNDNTGTNRRSDG